MNPSFLRIVSSRIAGSRLVSLAAVGAGALLTLQSCALGQGRNAHGAGFTRAAEQQTAVTGVVRDANGSPQVGTLVELLRPNLGVAASTFTDDRGRYSLPRVAPGIYGVKATASLFLPTLRENLQLLANSKLVVNLTLNTIYQAFQWLPAQPRSADEPHDDWNWTLRLSTNRPLLRVLENENGGGLVLVSDGRDTAPSRRVTVRSGSNRFGDGGMHQDLEIERNRDESHQLILRADLGQADSATVRSTAAYLHQMGPGTTFITVSSFSDRPEVLAGSGSGLQVATLRSAATMALGPEVTLEAGDELEAVHLGDTIVATHPFASLTLRHESSLGATIARYRIATSPDVEQASELDRDQTLAPRVSERGGALAFEQGMHQALEMEHQFASGTTGRWTTGLTYFHDTVEHPLIGGGVALAHGRPALTARDAESGNLLFDPATDLIAVSGEGYSADGLLAIARNQLTPSTWMSLRYAVGQALAMDHAAPVDSSVPRTLSKELERMHPHTASMVAASIGGKEQRAGTEWRASYRWQPSDSLTQVAPFDSSSPEAYLSFHVRQPIQLHYMGVRGMQAIVDVRNLLAQGYRPFYSQDGSTLYFAQAERCVEGGLSFTF